MTHFSDFQEFYTFLAVKIAQNTMYSIHSKGVWHCFRTQGCRTLRFRIYQSNLEWIEDDF